MAMASALSPPRVPKPKGALPSHYHESFLEKKGPRDQNRSPEAGPWMGRNSLRSQHLFKDSKQDYKKFWAGLQGLTLYFYNSNRDSQHVEKLDLGAFVKLTDEAPWGSSHDPGTHFCLVLRNQEIKFKVESLESRERWKGFILTVVELRVPSNLTLLPGHLYMMAEALAKEEARRALEMPSCFLKVSRLEAQLLLERYPECGNLLLRPSGDGTGALSVTTRQTLNGTPVVRHYKVKREGPKYVIDVEEPFSCTSIDAVVNYFVSHTNKALVPFLLDEDYEKVIGPAPLKGGPKQLPPMPVSSQDKLPPLLHQDENYVIPIGDTPAANYMNEDVPSPSRPVVLKPKKLAKFQAKPPKPPSVPRPEPKVLHSGLARKLAVSSAQAFFPTTGSNHSCGANPSHSRHFSSSGFSTLLKPLPHAPVMLRLLHEPSSASGKLFFAATPQVSATPGNPSSSSSAQPLPESRASLSSGSPQ
ncbi:signal-transducing adaptor protein 2 isoform X4 [Phacochoerus africanus]|uniref:signal-transducing adaptor protein 2 isoform X4 n=1 Tax=Phacochoerus africanus TaxID=41426 RepID=UPI001FD899BC|nr:signal-transducing adaptor protein 2 isoform X4 [Phacochoerus africanus]